MGYDTTNLKEFTRDYLQRSLTNYELIREEQRRQEQQEKKEQQEKEEQQNAIDENENDINIINKYYAVTQLINSLFGALIMTFESVKALNKGDLSVKNMKDINRKMEEADKKAFDKLSVVINELKESKKYFDSYTIDQNEGVAEIAFIRRLRNSFAHSGNKGLRFFPVNDNEQKVNKIESIILCDEEKRVANSSGQSEVFIAELTIKQVRTVFYSVVAIFSNFNDFKDYYDVRNYQSSVRLMRNKMNGVLEGVFEFEGKAALDMLYNKYSKRFRHENLGHGHYRGYIQFYDEMEFIDLIFHSNGKYKPISPEKAIKKMNEMAERMIIQ